MIEGPRVIGNMNLYALPIEHDKGTWSEKGAEITDAVGKFGVIIPEYFPPEYQSIPIPNSFYYDVENYVFSKVADICVQQKKDVWVIDPAHDASYIAFRTLIDTPFITATFLLMRYWLVAIRHLAGNPEVATRRQFLQRVGTEVAIPIYAALSWIGDGNTPLESPFRMSMVAQNLIEVGKSLRPKTDSLLIYPPAHWPLIQQYLDDEGERNRTIGRYTEVLEKLPLFKSLYQVRHYPEGTIS